jgi:predicted DNA-binding transcriptional regulator YafY
MSRTQRLLDLLQILRRHRYPVTGAALAAQLGISLRTLYRDIAALQQQGANIAGEAGMGYVLRPGYMLPPLMFSEEEIDALALGLRWVARQGDARLAAAARDTLAKIGAVLPPEFPRRPDRITRGLGAALSAPAPGAVQGMAQHAKRARTERGC